jgi:DNA-binding YbaB/EbfC family protein
MKNFGNIMKQAQQMQARMQEMEEKMASLVIEGKAGGGLVAATLNGKGELLKVDIAPSLLVVDEKEVLEDLIVAACNDAKEKIKQATADELSKITGGMKLPSGFNLPF